MSPGQKTLLIWVAIIVLIAYCGDINVGHVISGFLNGLQQIHNSNAHP